MPRWYYMSMENRVILIVGPTCVGKTGVSVLLAQELGSEIISADSMQIYRGMDIGTEKPTAQQLAAVRHHMIDVADPMDSADEFSAGRFLELVRPVIEGLHAAGSIPVMAGGTGLYVRALTRGLFDGPEADWELRASLMEESPEVLYARLVEVDPEAAGRLAPADVRRVVRALEVFLTSGQKVSTLRQESTNPLPYEFIKLGLYRDRAELYPMIEQRVDEMMERGLLDEVRGLLEGKGAMGEVAPTRTAMQAIGYKEVAAHLRGESSLEEAVELIKRNTRRYAKRQYTWFRREPELRWVDVTGCATPQEAYERVRLGLKAAGLDLH